MRWILELYFWSSTMIVKTPILYLWLGNEQEKMTQLRFRYANTRRLVFFNQFVYITNTLSLRLFNFPNVSMHSRIELMYIFEPTGHYFWSEWELLLFFRVCFYLCRQGSIAYICRSTTSRTIFYIVIHRLKFNKTFLIYTDIKLIT